MNTDELTDACFNGPILFLEGGTIFSFEPDGRTVKAVYSDEAFENPLPNPVQAVNGVFPDMYFKDGKDSYCLIVQNSRGETISKSEAKQPATEPGVEEIVMTEVPEITEEIV